MSRRNKAIGLTVALWVLWLNVNWAVRAQALLLGALIIRCNLKPAEACWTSAPCMLMLCMCPMQTESDVCIGQVDAIISHAEPYMHSAKKRARRLSVAAGDILRRHSNVGVPQAKMHAR